MSSLVKFSLIFLFISCANQGIRTKVATTGSDLFSGQVLARLESKSLEGILDQETNEFNKIIIECTRGEIKQSLKTLEQNYFQHENKAHYWMAKGHCLSLDNQIEQSNYFYKIAILKAQKDKKVLAVIFNNIGSNSWHKNEVWKAFKYFKDAHLLLPDNLVINYNLALFYLSFGKVDLAKDHISYFKNNLNDPDINSIFTFISLREENWNEVIKLSKLLPVEELKREDLGTYLAVAQFHLGQWEESLLTLSQTRRSNLAEINQLKKNLKEELDKKIEEKELALKRMAVK